MTLYHGSNADIDRIDLSRGLRYKDFGKGFYLTPSRVTAVRMAQKEEHQAHPRLRHRHRPDSRRRRGAPANQLP